VVRLAFHRPVKDIEGITFGELLFDTFAQRQAHVDCYYDVKVIEEYRGDKNGRRFLVKGQKGRHAA
jgi:hypothetical protein